ncbi:MAG: hypothetical protein AAB821_00700, partial [Patescibacteria group bacterium]
KFPKEEYDSWIKILISSLKNLPEQADSGPIRPNITVVDSVEEAHEMVSKGDIDMVIFVSSEMVTKANELRREFSKLFSLTIVVLGGDPNTVWVIPKAGMTSPADLLRL